MHDYSQADLDDQTRGMLDFAVKLTLDPSSNRKADIELLRGLGLNEQQILSTVLITCNFNFMTRLADGLGCLLYTSPSPRDGLLSRMPSSA